MTEAASPVPTPVAAPEGVRPRKETTFAGDVLKLVSGTTIAQGIGVLATPFLTRLYGPEAFGTLALFTSITGIIGVVACLRYELAIMLPETDEEAANLLTVSLLSVVGVTLLTIPAVTWGRGLIVRLLNAPELGPYLWAVPVAAFFGGVFQALSYWNSRKKEFGRLSVAKVVNTTVAHAAKIVTGVAGRPTSAALVGGTLIGSIASAVIVVRAFPSAASPMAGARRRLQAAVYSARRYAKFPLIDTWGALVSSLSWQVPALLLGRFFGADVVGHYSVSTRVLQMPMGLIGAAVGQVFFQRAAEAKAQGNLHEVAYGALDRLTSLVLFPLLLIIVSGRELFSCILGSSWAEAGIYGQILGASLFFWLLSSPISTIMSVLQVQEFGLGWSIAHLILRTAALWVGGLLGNARLALALFSACGAVMYLYAIVRLFSMCGGSAGELLPLVTRVLVRFVPVASVLGLVKVFLAPDWAAVIVAMLGIAAYYFVELRRLTGNASVASLIRTIRDLISGG